MRLAAQMQFRFPQFVPTPMSQVIPNASPEGTYSRYTLPPYPFYSSLPHVPSRPQRFSRRCVPSLRIVTLPILLIFTPCPKSLTQPLIV